jgi:predicted CoA-binding protein
MSSMATVQEFLSQKRLAVVGLSRQPKDFSRALFHALRDQGYDVVPVNPEAEERSRARSATLACRTFSPQWTARC